MPGQSSTITAGKLGLAGVGIALVWSGLSGKKWSVVLKDLIAGKSPKNAAGTPITDPASTLAGITTTNPFTSNTGPVSSNAAANMATGQRLAAGYGWASGEQWAALRTLWNNESGWNNNAQNSSSTAYGIAQFLDTTWAGTGFSKSSNATIQIEAGLLYIKLRYGNPVNALNFWNSHSPHWY
jgi:hypothetical protein